MILKDSMNVISLQKNIAREGVPIVAMTKFYNHECERDAIAITIPLNQSIAVLKHRV